jgi:hypothetical protein
MGGGQGSASGGNFGQGGSGNGGVTSGPYQQDLEMQANQEDLEMQANQANQASLDAVTDMSTI